MGRKKFDTFLGIEKFRVGVKKYVFEDISSRSIDCNKKNSNRRNIFQKMISKLLGIFRKISKFTKKFQKKSTKKGGYIKIFQKILGFRIFYFFFEI